MSQARGQTMGRGTRKFPRSMAQLITALLSLCPAIASADWALNMRPGVTPNSQGIYHLHMIVLWICVVIGVLVFGVMFYSILHFRKSRGARAAHFHENTTVEIVWTLIPFVILVCVAVPATRTLIAMESTGNADMTIKATGYQWRWHYDYLDQGVSFFSVLAEKSNEARQPRSGIDPHTVENYLLDVDQPLVVPVGKKVRLLTTANDVIHAWWVPELGVKRDAIPGFINESWFKVETPGTYRGQCAELCGKDHGFMPIVVVAKEEGEFNKWVEDKKAAALAEAAANDPNREWKKEELMAKGAEVYTKNCAVCHQADGKGVPGNFPALAGSEIANGNVDDHIDRVLFGKNQMPAWKETLSPVEIAAVITYERNSFGNTAGDVVQPKKVAEY